MSAVSAVRVTAEDPGDASLAAVLGAGFAAAGQRAARLAALLDPGFLAEAGWDPVTRVLAPESEHRLIRWDGERLRLEAPARREGPAPRVPEQASIRMLIRKGTGINCQADRNISLLNSRSKL